MMGGLGDLSSVIPREQEDPHLREHMDPDVELLLEEPEWGPDTPETPLEPQDPQGTNSEEAAMRVVESLLEDLMSGAHQHQGTAEPPALLGEETGLEEDSWESLLIMDQNPQVCSIGLNIETNYIANNSPHAHAWGEKSESMETFLRSLVETLAMGVEPGAGDEEEPFMDDPSWVRLAGDTLDVPWSSWSTIEVPTNSPQQEPCPTESPAPCLTRTPLEPCPDDGPAPCSYPAPCSTEIAPCSDDKTGPCSKTAPCSTEVALKQHYCK